MLFNTLSFYAVFIGMLSVYAILQRSSRLLMMIYVVAFSLFFFARMNPEVTWLLPLTALASWAMTRQMDMCRGKRRTGWIWGTVAVELLPLLYFKYTNFGLDVINTLLKSNLPLPDIILPVGISFYTFQAISYSVDVYRGELKERMTLLEYLFFLTFFPLLLAGPITRAATILRQLRREEGGVDPRLLRTGLWLVMMGIVKKCIVADYLAQFNNWAFDSPQLYDGFELLMGVLGFSMQIYCDFSGYSDMSIGMAAMMGLRLSENFCFPYQSCSITEFWRRWHISLSSWFRDYVYIPLGGNRVAAWRMYLNNFITMVVAGLWHGSTLMFALWGAMHGAALVVHKWYGSLRGEEHPLRSPWWQVVPGWLLCQAFLLVTWVFFRCSSLDKALFFIHRIFSEFTFHSIPAFLHVRTTWCLVLCLSLLAHGIREKWFYRIQERFISLPWPVQTILLLAVVQLAIELQGSDVAPFLYYKF